MSGWLDPVRAALDLRDAPVDCFFRDDDGGWGNGELVRLVSCFERAETPLDIAMIPAATDAALAAYLLERKRHGAALLGLHQHGCSHLNHENAGRKCEFGASRSSAQQSEDIATGRDRLQRLLGDAMDPIFTPPWNRCTGETIAALADLGFSVLSRNRGASPEMQGGLRELNVHVDWMRHRASTGPDHCAIADAVVESLRYGEPLGIMLHHAVMGEGDFHALSDLLSAMRSHPRVTFRSMAELAARAQQRRPS